MKDIHTIALGTNAFKLMTELIDEYYIDLGKQRRFSEVEHKKATKAKRQELKVINKLPKTKLKRRL